MRERLIRFGPATRKLADRSESLEIFQAFPKRAAVHSDPDAVLGEPPPARYVVDHVPDAWVQEIPGAGHASPLTHPEALAEAFTEFFASVQQPA